MHKGRPFTVRMDDEDYARLGRYSMWIVPDSKSKNRYYRRIWINGNAAALHRLILDAPRGSVVDHKSGNGLDCRRCNMVTTGQKLDCLNRRRPNPGMRSRRVWRGGPGYRVGYRDADGRRRLRVFRSEVIARLIADETLAAETRRPGFLNYGLKLTSASLLKKLRRLALFTLTFSSCLDGTQRTHRYVAAEPTPGDADSITCTAEDGRLRRIKLSSLLTPEIGPRRYRVIQPVLESVARP
jgi:hypothetical protein